MSTHLAWIRKVWVSWLRFEFRAIAVLLPIACLELTAATTLLAHLPLYTGLLGSLPMFLARDAWRFAGQIGTRD
jgi:hypothetical protein